MWDLIVSVLDHCLSFYFLKWSVITRMLLIPPLDCSRLKSPCTLILIDVLSQCSLILLECWLNFSSLYTCHILIPICYT